MIHSLAGGSFREKRVEDFALVEIVEGVMKNSKFWYLVGKLKLNIDDAVIVPFGSRNTELKARVIRVDNGVIEGQTPVPLRSAKYVLRRVEN